MANRFPLLPLEEEGRLNDPPLRENFIERVLPVEKHDKAYYRWTKMLAERTGSRRRTASPFVRFHTAHKLTRETCSLARAMAHGPS